MKKLLFLSLSLIFVFFNACSSKRVYEPENVKDDWKNYGDLNQSIIDVTSSVALLQNRKILTKNNIIDVIVPKGYRLLASNDSWIISSTIDGKLKLQYIDDTSMDLNFNLKKTIASANVEGDVLAILFADNEMALYSISSKKLLLKEHGGTATVVDSRIVTPQFLRGIVIFPTLDGKVTIINIKSRKKLRSTIISSEDNFNNVLSFNLIDQKIIAVTAHKILSMSKHEKREKFEIRNVAYNKKHIFLTTKHGEIVSLNSNLEQSAKLKFPFAHFLGLIVTDERVFALEKEGYLIVAPKDLSSCEVYEVDIGDGFVFVTEDKFYVNNEYILIE